MIRNSIVFVLWLMACASMNAMASSVLVEAQSLISRVVPSHAKQFVCEVISQENDADVFEVESANGKVVLRGNNAVSIASAFNWYLKTTAKCDFSECGSQLKLPKTLPEISSKVRRVATVPHRFMFNYCTYGYTMPWWDWPRWERELDWMAMHGINMPFIMTGQEAVWIKTFTQYGYTEKEVRQWLGSPAHFPWTFMQNMHSFGGELPAEWTPQRVNLANKIINRARALGMNTVLQGYYGMVLPNFAQKHPKAKVIPQGKWGSSGLARPDMLDPTDPMFLNIAATFMREQERLFGRAGYYMADPFHEGGKATGVNMSDCGVRTLAAMQAQDPNAVWIKMCWQSDNAALLAKVPDDRVIALDLWAENSPFWPKGAFKGKPWMWCLLHNFGGNTDYSTDLAHLAKVFPETLANSNKGKLVGLALTPEGHCNAPVVYELISEFVWCDHEVDLKSWLPDYVTRRYGCVSTQAQIAWQDIAATIGAIPYQGVQTPPNSLLQARPMKGEKARFWTHTRVTHDAARLVDGWRHLIAAAPECRESDGYRYDLADITRQVLGDLARPVYERIQLDVKNKNLEAFNVHTQLFLKLLDDSDAITGTRPEFLLGVWLSDARSWGKTPESKDLHESQARMLITSWDGHAESGDYGCRQWSGLLRDYYRPRWKLYFEALGASVKSATPIDKVIFMKQLETIEKSWEGGHQRYSAVPTGDTVTLARQLADAYLPVFKEFYANHEFTERSNNK